MKPNQLFALLATLALAAGLTTRASASTIAYWKFEPGNFLADSSGNGHTLTNAPTTAVPGGGAGSGFDTLPTSVTSGLYANINNHTMSGGAASFSSAATNSLMTVNTLGLNTYKSLTMEWFMKGTGQANATSVEPLFAGSAADINGVTGDFSFDGSGIFRDFTTANLNTAVDLAWHEYAVVLDTSVANGGTGTGMKLYKDYVLVASTAVNAAPFTDKNFVVGKDFYGGSAGGAAGRILDGQLDEISLSSGLLGPGTFLSEQLIPEPSTVMLLGVGGLMVWRRMKKS